MEYFIEAITTKYADFSGRARRREFWLFVFFAALGFAAIWIADHFSEMAVPMEIKNVPLGIGGMLSVFFSLLLLIPLLAVGTRRLHDTKKSGWCQLIALVPFIGWIILLIWYCQDSKVLENQYGYNPKRTRPRGDL